MSKELKDNPSNISKDKPKMTEFQKSLIYKDIGDFINMSQLELSKKIPKWKRVWNEMRENGAGRDDAIGMLTRKHHLLNYCRDCNRDSMFWNDRYQVEGETSYRNYLKPRQDFWLSYIKKYETLLMQADEFYESKKALIDNERKEKLNDYLKEEVVCECGGKYSHRNKAKHFLTQKHLKFLNK